MGMYLNQLPPTEVARLKAELAETLIANFCYPRFYDYRANALRMRPVDRAKRQEVWQYLNAVDFNVWGRVDVDSPDFQRQVERLFIHFVQRNRSFFGEQGRKRMTDVRTLITSCSTSLAENMRGHLRGQQENPPFGSPRPVTSWSISAARNAVDLPWERVLAETMQVQQQLQELRGEVRPASAPVPSTPPAVHPPSPSRPGTVPSRRSRSVRSASNGVLGNGNGPHENESMSWPSAGNNRPLRSSEMPPAAPFSSSAAEPDHAEAPSFPTSSEAAPTLPLPLGKSDSLSLAAAFQPLAPIETSPAAPDRSLRNSPIEVSPATPLLPASPSGPLPGTSSRPLPIPNAAAQMLPPAMPAAPARSVKSGESTEVLTGDEDMVIFEQMRHQLVVWLRVQAVRAGVSLSGQNAFQLVDSLRHQDGMDAARLQVVSTLLNMCDQIITSGRATLFDYKQAMMFYLMHTRRSQ
jgi:hypothetical protein